MTVRVGVQIEPQHVGFAEIRDAWRAAEGLGVDTIFTWDHFFPLHGDRDGAHFEGLATLAAMAEDTSRAQVGLLVAGGGYRNPDLLADAHRTIDHISGGRAILGIGAGYAERDYREYDYTFPSAAQRGRDLAAALPRIRARLAGLNPPPLGDLPILIAGVGERITLRIVAEHADIWHGYGPVELFHRKDAVLREHCAAVGRDPAAIERSWSSVHDDLHDLDELADAGVRHVIQAVRGTPGGYDLGVARELVAWRDRRNAGG